ncbi:allantoin permease [Stemphylium lycopersici]|uniref:Allantoin permease n=1 Tax=Stemphylium lycopersici TaxID=183478 RepID=A0A364NCD7_STELY|nr:major facilitator superfamily transporter [Stemphylium lycopersici]RAR06138.1 allantoin permease [Stemphylium lycopersici]RAR14857.1 allantoin permease [Stemphylium lycopersici]
MSVPEKEVINESKSGDLSPSPQPYDVEIGTVDETSKHTNGDEALKFLKNAHDVGMLTPEGERILLRKIDWMVMPLMWCCYCLQYLDKTLVNYAAVMGLYDDANITTDQFSNLALFFYVSYLIVEFPHGYGMQRLPTAKYLGAAVILWGLVTALTCVCKNYGALAATRVLLGCFEAAVAPSLILITSMWYKRNEQPIRTGIWYLGVGTGTMIGSLISFGFQHYYSPTFTSWQIMFLVVGLVTVAVGISVVLLLPDNPMSSRLTPEEKVWAIERLRENQTGIENTHFKFYQVLECFKDPQTWMLSLITISSNVPNGAVSSYQATLIKSFGFDSKTTALLQLPSGVVSIISILTATYLAGRFNQRGLNVVTLLIPGMLGGCLMAFLPGESKAGKLIGNYLTNCIGASLPLLYSWVAANYAGHTKKVTMNAILLMSFCLGNIIGPLTFRQEDQPDFIPAKITIVVTCAFAAVMALVLRAYYTWMNKKRDREADHEHVENEEFLDLTDWENKRFRYRL